MHWIDWIIFGVPLAMVIFMALHCGKYIRDTADFLAAGRVAGRYVISVGDMQTSLAIIYLISATESEMRCGMAMGFWNHMMMPVAIFISLTGYISYRYRQTRCLSLGQFLELRYNRVLRIAAATIRTISEMLTNSIGPAVAGRFFIYFLGLPHSVRFFSWEISTFALVMVVVLLLAMLIIWPGGRVSLLVTDALQGLMSYPIFVIFTCFVLSEISWGADVAPILMDRVPGESFVDPMDIHNLRDFNLFAFIVALLGSIVNRGAWIGNDTSSAGRTAHEQKMAGILGAWRSGFSALMISLLALFVMTVMLSDRYESLAGKLRVSLGQAVVDEVIIDPVKKNEVQTAFAQFVPPKHRIGVDQPFSQKDNPDTRFLEEARKVLVAAPQQKFDDAVAAGDSGSANDAKEELGAARFSFQKIRTLYYQMMAPSVLHRMMPMGMMGLFLLLMVMLMLSTDDSRIFNAAATLVQDVVMPLRKKPFTQKEHFLYLRLMSVLVCLIFFFASLFLSQIDYIQMFIQIMCALWLGAAGPIMFGGLYTRWGNSVGATCALIFGSGTAALGLFFQRNWARMVYPWLSDTGYVEYVDGFFSIVNSVCSPLIVWEMSDVKFPVNSFEISFISTSIGIGAYVAGSLIGHRHAYNLDQLLHRGKYALPNEPTVVSAWTWKNFASKLIGITPEYSKSDRIIAWSVFIYSIVFQFGVAFIGVLIWNWISPWPREYWSWYKYIMLIVVGILVGCVSTVWFLYGGIRDMRRLFKDLANRKHDQADDGWVEPR